jgi:hypothetical protein
MSSPNRLGKVPCLFPVFLLLGMTSCSSPSYQNAPPQGHIQNVFIIMMENHNWTGAGANSIENNPNAPYINQVLIPMGAHPSNYNNPPHMHPSLPNYLWLEAGTNFGILTDGPAVAGLSQTTTLHLVTLLKNAGISWKAYDEAADGKTCPLTHWHTPFVFFDDVTDNMNPQSSYCISHIRPLSELTDDLKSDSTARYNFIVPNDCHSMHSPCNGGNQIAQGDEWLSEIVPQILGSSAYKNGVLFIVWDEAEKGDGPIPMLVLSPFAKTGGYTNLTYYNHGSTLRTVEEIFGVQPLLRDAAKETDLSDFFNQFP